MSEDTGQDENEWEGWLDVPGGRVHYFRGGSGEPVVLLHGGGIDGAGLSWAGVFPSFAEEYDTFAFDLPGYADTEVKPVPTNTADLVRFIDTVLTEAGITRAIFIAISMGGSLALAYAKAFPEKVRGMVLIAPTGLAEQLPSHRRMWFTLRLSQRALANASNSAWINPEKARTSLSSLYNDSDNVEQELVDETVRLARKPNSSRAYVAWTKNNVGWSQMRTYHVPYLSEIKTPTLFLHGDNDKIIPLSGSQKAADAMPNARIRVIAECGHWVQREREDKFLSAVAEFIKTLRS